MSTMSYALTDSATMLRRNLRRMLRYPSMTVLLIGMPIASTMGLAGSPKQPMVIPWLLNRNGQAITLKADWKGKVGADPKAHLPHPEVLLRRGAA